MDEITPDFRHNRKLQWMVGWLTFYLALTAIEPNNFRDWLLENLLVFIYGTLLFASYKRFAFSNLSYGLFTLFLTLHMTGAHYTYAETPIGFWIQDWFDFERNHYDRIVHFSYGLLCGYPIYEVLRRLARTAPAWSAFLCVNVVLAFSAFFEVAEAITAEMVDPELGDAYLGLQGDMWDAQKDMGLAMLGAIIAMGITLKRRDHGKRKSP
jgi:putative membrane protein